MYYIDVIAGFALCHEFDGTTAANCSAESVSDLANRCLLLFVSDVHFCQVRACKYDSRPWFKKGITSKYPPLVRRKPGVLRPGFVGMRGQWSYDYGMQDYEYNPHRGQI